MVEKYAAGHPFSCFDQKKWQMSQLIISNVIKLQNCDKSTIIHAGL